jgi:CubicO group peptidase (beta-lactamase class C family)
MMAAAVIAVAVDRGWINYEDKVTKHWPEFGQNEKGHIKISDVLRHDVGIYTLDETITLQDVAEHNDTQGRLSSLLAKQQPWTWAAGVDEGKTPRIYHAITRGWLLNQILMRAHPEGKSISQVLAEEITGE